MADRDIFDEFRKLEENMERMFEEMWGTRKRRPLALLPGERSIERYEPGETLFPDVRRPFVDIVETDKEIVATAEMPGLEKEDIKINITEDILEISAEKKHEEERKEKNYIYRERRSGSFYRSMGLSATVDPNNAKATYNNGVLEIKAPKTEIKKKTPVKVE